MNDLRVGDEVRVFDVNGRRMGQPEGGWPGTVTRVGRTLMDVSYNNRTETFRRDSGARHNDGYGHRRVKTLEQVAQDARRAEAVEALSKHGVELRWGFKLTIEQLEALAEVARSFPTVEA
jgi:hypothetical protein